MTLVGFLLKPFHVFRRREDIIHMGGAGGSGVTWSGDIKQFVLENFCKVSTSTVRRLGLAPHPNTNAARYYRGCINARPTTVQNNKSMKTHQNSHYCAANVKSHLEAAADMHEFVTFVSVDDKCKLQVCMKIMIGAN